MILFIITVFNEILFDTSKHVSTSQILVFPLFRQDRVVLKINDQTCVNVDIMIIWYRKIIIIRIYLNDYYNL